MCIRDRSEGHRRHAACEGYFVRRRRQLAGKSESDPHLSLIHIWIIPAEQSGEYFGLLDICGKGASFVGTTLVGVVSQVTHNINLGVGAIALLFAVGICFFRLAVRTESTVQNS